MKIAILVLAHTNKSQLRRLIVHLCDDFDIYVHLDKKSTINEKDISVSSNVYIMKKHKVYWGSFNQIKATLSLFDMALSNKKYDRFLLISGQDLPIKANSEIIQYFENNRTKEFLEYEQMPKSSWTNGGLDRVTKYNQISTRGVVGFDYIKLVALNMLIDKINKYYMPKRNLDLNLFGGSQWLNLSDKCVEQIDIYLKNNINYIDRFKLTYCADEIFFQTIIVNLMQTNQLINSSLRYVDWNAGPEFPRILRINDYDRIMTSEAIFARKFDENIDAEIIEKIYSDIRVTANCI